MDNPRFLIAIALSFLVFILWQMFGIDKEQVQHIQQEQNQQITEQSATPIIEEQPFVKGITHDNSLTQQEKAARTISINTPLYSVQITEKGAVLKSFVLKNYKENGNVDSPLLEMIPSEISDAGTVAFGLDKKSIPD